MVGLSKEYVAFTATLDPDTCHFTNMTKYKINTVSKINNKSRVVDTDQDQKEKDTRDLKAFRSLMPYQTTHGDWHLPRERCSRVNVICLDGTETFVLTITKLVEIMKIRSY